MNFAQFKMKILHLMCITVFFLTNSCQSQENCQKNLCKAVDYEKGTLPNTTDEAPLKIHLSSTLRNIVHVDYKSKTITIDMELIQEWYDPRITSKHKKVGLSVQDLEDIWRPDLMIHGIKEMKIHQTFEAHNAAWIVSKENKHWIQLVSTFDFTIVCEMR